MLRLCVAGPLLLMASFAAGQSNSSNSSNPLYPAIRPQPNPSTQPGAATDPSVYDPTELAGAPPAFVPGQGVFGGGSEAPAPPRVRGPVRISGGVMAGNILTRVNPTYPPDARAAGVQGAVVLTAMIGKDGVVQNLEVISGPPALTAAAVDAVRQWIYRPYLLNGEPTEVQTTITVNFRLQSPPPQQ